MRASRSVIAIAVLLAASALPAYAQMPTFQENEKCMKAEDEAAIRLCGELIQNYPNLQAFVSHWYAGRARGYAKLGKHDLALADRSAVIALREKSDSVEAEDYVQRARIARKTGDLTRALADYDRAIDKASDADDKVEYLAARASVHSERKDFNSAIADATEAIELAPKDYSYWANRGLYFRFSGDYDRAIADYNKAIELGADKDEIYFKRGVAYELKGDKALAMADLERVLLNYPNSEDVKDALKRVYQMR